MNTSDDAGKASGSAKKPKAAVFRMKYIVERLKELNAERDRLIRERQTMKALRKSKKSKDAGPAESEA